MAGPIDDPPPRVTITPAGSVQISTGSSAASVASRAGDWQLLPPAGELLVFRRAGEPLAPEHTGRRRGVKLCGVIEGPDALTNLLTAMHMNQDSGALHVARGQVHKILHIQRGKLLAGSSNQLADRLGERLIQLGLITPEQRDACVSASTRLGRELVRRQILTNHQVYDGMRRQSEEIFLSALRLEDGCFYLVKPLDLQRVPAMLHLDLQELLLDGLRRDDELRHLRTIVPSLEVVLRRHESIPEGTIDPTLARLFEAMDDERPLSELIQTLHLDELSATRAAAELVKRGFAELRSPDALRRAKPVEDDLLSGNAAETIIDAYGAAFRLLAAALPPELRGSLTRSIAAFLRARDVYAHLFDGIAVASDGTLERERLLRNVAASDDAHALASLQRGLDELLFFVLFEIGHSLEVDAQERLHRDVARALSRLPSPPQPPAHPGA